VGADAIGAGARQISAWNSLRKEAEARLKELEAERNAREFAERLRREVDDLRLAATAQCNAILAEAEREADAALEKIEERVFARLLEVRERALAELGELSLDESEIRHRPLVPVASASAERSNGLRAVDWGEDERPNGRAGDGPFAELGLSSPSSDAAARVGSRATGEARRRGTDEVPRADR